SWVSWNSGQAVDDRRGPAGHGRRCGTCECKHQRLDHAENRCHRARPGIERADAGECRPDPGLTCSGWLVDRLEREINVPASGRVDAACDSGRGDSEVRAGDCVAERKLPTSTCFPKCWRDLGVMVEVEAKAKELAVLKLAKDLQTR